MKGEDVRWQAIVAQNNVAMDPAVPEEARTLLAEFSNSFQPDEYETLARFYKEFPDAAGMLLAVEALRPGEDHSTARTMMFDHLRAAEVLYQGEDLAVAIEEGRVIVDRRDLWTIQGQRMEVEAVVPYMQHFVKLNKDTLMPEVLERIEAVIESRLNAALTIRTLREAGEEDGR